MPLTDKGKEVMANLINEYGPEEGEKVFYAMKNKGELTGVDSGERFRFYVTEQLSDNIGETPEGFLLCQNVPITRVGEFIYRKGEVPVTPGPSGEIRIKREAGEVFAPETIASFEGKPVTINHPTGFVDPENWQKLANGHLQNVRQGENGQGDLLLADLLITTEEAIKLVKAGLREVSCGYDAQYEELEPGVGMQHEIIGNHVALVARGRAGSRCAIGDNKACDGCGNCGCGKQTKTSDKEDDEMKDFKQFKEWLRNHPFKDADEETEEEKKAREAKEKEKETADKCAKDKGFKDAEEEEDFKKWREEKAGDKKGKGKDQEGETEEEKEARLKKEKEDKETADKKKAKDAEGDRFAEIMERLEALEGIVSEFIAGEVERAEAADKAAKDAETTTEKAEQAEKEEEEKATSDCATHWQDIASNVEILFPGMKPNKPTKDFAKFLTNTRRTALQAALSNKDTRDVVAAVTQGKPVRMLTGDALVSAFNDSAKIIAELNNGKASKGKVQVTQDHLAMSREVASINKRNKEFWKQQH